MAASCKAAILDSNGTMIKCVEPCAKVIILAKFDQNPLCTV